MKSRKLLSAVLLFLCAGAAHADWTMDFIRISCIPEARYIRFDYTPISGHDVELETAHNDKKRRERMLVWKKHGYHEPTRLQHECRLPGSTYTISASHPPARDTGNCGAAPRVTLSLLRNGRPVLNKVVFGADCHDGPTVVSAEISDGYQGSGERSMTLCLSPEYGAPQVCEFFINNFPDDIPVDQKKVIELTAKKIP